jgi:large subunit ribosomal protein L13
LFIAVFKKRFVFLRTTILGLEYHKQTNKSRKVDTLSYKTKSANKETVKKEWVLVDANDQILGRLASNVAFILRGKHKPDFTPHVDGGDNVIIINAEKVKLTGKKMTDKQYFRHTGYPGGQVIETPEKLMAKKPIAVVEKAVKGMLPKSRLGAELFRNLNVYAGSEHPHEAQKPKKINHNDIK